MIKYGVIAIIVLSLITGIVVAIYNKGRSDENADWQAKWDAQELKLAEDRTKAEKEQREIEQEWQSKINRVQHNAETQIHFLEVDLAAANNSAVSLREQAKRLAERASRACQGPSVGSSSETAKSTSVVLAELLARVEEAGRGMAEESDRRRIAGLACEDAYMTIYTK